MRELGQEFIVALDREQPIFSDDAMKYIDKIHDGRNAIVETLKKSAAVMREKSMEDIRRAAAIIIG